MTKIKEIIQGLEQIAPPALQESYDNSGLLVGDASADVSGVLCTLDCTEEVVQEAIIKKANLIVAHHPIVFSGLKRLTGSNYVQRTVQLAIKNDIAIYAIHTNLDNVLRSGVNQEIANKLGLVNQQILRPKKNTLLKLEFYVPMHSREAVMDAIFQAGAGQIGNYKNCSFRSQGIGSYTPTEGANPYSGTIGETEQVKEEKVEVILPFYLQTQVVQALQSSHPYEEVAYYLSPLENTNQDVGAGVIGNLEKETSYSDILSQIKEIFKTGCIRYTKLLDKKVSKIALCGGSGSEFLSDAVRQRADLFISADFKYHQFFDADGQIVIADIGHFESEQYTVDLLSREIQKLFSNFAVYFSETITNPISYFT